MRILQVCAYAAPYEGNFIRSLRSLEESLDAAGHEFIYAFPETARDLPWCQALRATHPVYFLPLGRARIRWRTYSTIRRIFRDNGDIGIAHSHFELYDIPVAAMAPRGAKVYWHLHDAIEQYSDWRNSLLNRMQYGLCHGKAVLLSVSEMHTRYVERLGFPKGRIRWIPNGIDTDRIKRANSPLDQRDFDFLIFGWEYERKGVDLAIRAFLELGGEDLRLGIVGGDEARIIRDFGRIPQGVRIVEPVRDINLLYGQAKCFLHISRAEGMSYALLEAVYAGLPVICSDIPANRFAADFATVALVRDGDALSVAGAMRGIIARGFCVEGDSDRKMVEKGYSIASWVENMTREYGLQ